MWMWIVSVDMDDELEELLIEVDEVKVCIHLTKEGEYEWYTFVEYVVIYIRRMKKSVNGICVYMFGAHSSKERKCE